MAEKKPAAKITAKKTTAPAKAAAVKPAEKTVVKPAPKETAKQSPVKAKTQKPEPKTPAIKYTPAPKAKAKVKGVVAKPAARRSKGDSIALFIDLDNTNANVTNILEILSILRTFGNISFGKFYGYTDDKVIDFEEVVLENKLETAGRLRFKTDGVSVIDTRLIMDSVKLAEKHGFDSIFVWAGVGDLSPLFARFKEIGAKTLTVDLPDFDCKNKFVDQAIKLYSPHSMGEFRRTPPLPIAQVQPDRHFKPEPEPEPVKPKKPKALLPTEIDLGPAPVLPRKEGAPALGVQGEMSPEEFEKFLLKSAAGVIEKMDIENAKRKESEDFASLHLGGTDKMESAFHSVNNEKEPEPETTQSQFAPEQNESTDKYEVSGFGYDANEAAEVVIPNENPPKDETEDFNNFGDDFGNLTKFSE